MKDIRDYSLKNHNTFGLNACCDRFLEFYNVSEAMQVVRLIRSAHQPYLIIGGGSNLLLTKDFAGLVLHSAIKDYMIEGRRMKCGSGMAWDDVVSISIQNGLYGAENLSLIPGDVGASAVQNIGAYGAEVKDLIVEIRAIEIQTGQLRTFTPAECQYGYRQSRFKNEWKNKYLITSVTYEFSKVFNPRLEYGNIRSELERRGVSLPTPVQLRQVIIDLRNEKLPDPKVMGNAGSFFVNPVVIRPKFEELLARYPQMPHYFIDKEHEKIPAGWLIEQCGWKGRALGAAGVYDRQALVLVNRGGATGADIVRLCNAIQHDVRQTFGIDIQTEVNIV
ncbi:MAG: UDP-N-acetylmuramate dehydrogenase [Prevotella sp.]|nr:UDP-N-acetylmuramate dehydrogenase [Prevotella sp.]